MTNLTIIISSGSMWSSSQRGIFAATSPSFISFAGKGKTFSSQESGINNILVPTTTAVTADTSSKESPANRICALQLFPFGHLYSVLNRCAPSRYSISLPSSGRRTLLFLPKSISVWLSWNALGPADAGPPLPAEHCGWRLHLSSSVACSSALLWQCSQ